MKSKVWFYFSVAQAVIILFGIFAQFAQAHIPQRIEYADLTTYVSQFSEENNCLPDEGSIPDAKVAKKIGGAMIDEMTHYRWGVVYVTYDAEHRLWMVEKGYFFHPRRGAFVVIEQDTGRVLKALRTK